MCQQRKGRPPTGKARKVKVDTRLSKEELVRLGYCCKITGKSKSEVIRDGVEVLYAKLENLNTKNRELAHLDKEERIFL